MVMLMSILKESTLNDSTRAMRRSLYLECVEMCPWSQARQQHQFGRAHSACREDDLLVCLCYLLFAILLEDNACGFPALKQNLVQEQNDTQLQLSDSDVACPLLTEGDSEKSSPPGTDLNPLIQSSWLYNFDNVLRSFTYESVQRVTFTIRQSP